MQWSLVREFGVSFINKNIFWWSKVCCQFMQVSVNQLSFYNALFSTDNVVTYDYLDENLTVTKISRNVSPIKQIINISANIQQGKSVRIYLESHIKTFCSYRTFTWWHINNTQNNSTKYSHIPFRFHSIQPPSFALYFRESVHCFSSESHFAYCRTNSIARY